MPALSADFEDEDGLPPGVKFPEMVETVVPDSCPWANVLNPQSPLYNPEVKRMLEQSPRLGSVGKDGRDEPEQQFWGTYIWGVDNLTKVHARQASWTSIVVDEDEWLYAPTLLCPNYCPIEVVTFYHKHNGEMQRWWIVFDHHDREFINATKIERDDAQAWTRYSYFGYYNTRIVWDDTEEEWQALLYNWYTPGWETKYATSDTTEGMDYWWDDNGWDMWEEYGFYDDGQWPELGRIRSKDLQVYIDDASPDWHKVTSSYGDELDWGIDDENPIPYDRRWVKQYYYWTVYGDPD